MAEQILEPLLAELRDMIDRVDPVPDAVLTAAKASFVWRTVDAELAELAADSLDTVASVRSNGPARLLTFEAKDAEIEVEVAATGPTRRLTGQLVPPGPASVTVRWASGSIDTTADELGRFIVDAVPATTVSLSIVRTGAANPVVTSWVAI